MTNQTQNKVRKLSTRLSLESECVALDFIEIATSLRQIFKNSKNKNIQRFSNTFTEISFVFLGLICELQKDKEMQRLIDKSKSKSSEKINNVISFMEEKLDAYIKINDK